MGSFIGNNKREIQKQKQKRDKTSNAVRKSAKLMVAIQWMT